MRLDKAGQRRTKYYKDNPVAVRLRDIRNNPRRNAISKIAYGIAGSYKKFYALSKIERVGIRATATQLHELGVDIGTADRAEQTEKRGFVYIITNKAWPEYVKIGRAFDPDARLSGYQTSCPYRDYELRYAVYFNDCYQAERSVHYMLDKWRRGGEWFFADVEEATQLIDRLRETTSCGQR